MPADERTAKMMNKPVCPAAGGRLQDDVVRLVQQLIQEAEGKLAAACAEAERTRHYAVVGETMDSVKADVWGLASYIANHIGADWQPRRSEQR